MELKQIAIPWQIRVHLFLFFASLLWIVVPAVNKTPNNHVARQSSVAAAEFLYLVDIEEYSHSWEVASETLKNMLSQETWNEKIAQIRDILGPVVERIHHEITYTDSASGVPEGEYVVMTFVSRFKFRERVVETLTLMLGSDDQWRVVGYFLT